MMTREQGGGLMVLATAVLVALKLSGQITWSWIVVLAPLWLPAAVAVGTRLAVAAVFAAGIYLVFLDGEPGRILEVLNGIPLVRDLPWERLLG
jgi:hypothetical protein